MESGRFRVDQLQSGPITMYITDHAEQIQLIREMTQLRKDMETFEVFFHHPYSGQLWKSFYPQATGEELGPKILRHEPLPEDLEELITICLTDEVPQNAIGLGIELAAQAGQWVEIFRILESGFKKWNSRQLRLFLQYLAPEKFPENLERFRNGESADELISDPEMTLKELQKLSRRMKLKSYFF